MKEATKLARYSMKWNFESLSDKWEFSSLNIMENKLSTVLNEQRVNIEVTLTEILIYDGIT